MNTKIIIMAAAVVGLANACEKYEYPFRNPNLTAEQRAADLVQRLTLEEKVLQMLNQTPAIERLSIPPYDWWNECLHGAARTKYKTTVFPQAIAMAAAWNAAAVRQMADATAMEGRAIYNTAAAKGDYSRYHGLTYWSPNINIVRDPRWGRAQETYGEDPFLTAVMGENFVLGLQGDANDKYLKAAACAKHYAVHSGPEASRHRFNAEVSNYDLWDTYLPAFQRLVVNAKVAGVMCAYNAFRGQPCCASDFLMQDILRGKWNFRGYVTSDCGAIDDFFREWGHKTHSTAAIAAADALQHSTDVDCGNAAYKALLKAVDEGLVTQAQIDTSLTRLFTIRFRLGMFDSAKKNKYAKIDSTYLERKEHQDLALALARQSIVMLKNDGGMLPLKKEQLKKIAVMGPNADNMETQLGNYNGFPSRMTTLLDGIRNEAGEVLDVVYSRATAFTGEVPKSFGEVIDSIKDADIIIYAGGSSPRLEGEEGDGGERTSILLPKVQTEFLKEVKKLGKPIILVIMTGSAVSMPWEVQNIPVILNAWFGGQAAGTAVADVLFGNYNPSGRLPVTFYGGDEDLPPFDDYSMKNRTYRYFGGIAQFPFGYGLSYSKFDYQWVQQPKQEYSQDEDIVMTISVKNISDMQGDEVVQVYVKYPQDRGLPLRELKYFTRVSLGSAQSKQIKISIAASTLAKWDDSAQGMVVPTGQYIIYAGGHSQDERAVLGFTIK